MDDTTNQPRVYDDEIRLKDLIRVLADGKWLYLGITLAVALAAGAASVLLPKTYQASVMLSPVTQAPGSQMGGMGSIISEFGGLASLAGLSVGGDSKKAESLAVLQSQSLTQEYIQNNNLLPVLFRKKWNAQTKQWNVQNPDQVPTLWKANELFKKKIRKVTTDTKSGLVTLTISWTDPQLATKWANDLVKATNDFLRKKAIDESQRNIAYLNSQASRTDVIGIRQAIYAILQNEINKEMLARGSDEYALKVVDSALVPEEPSTPPPLVWILAGLFAGLLLSVLTAFVRLAWARS